MAYKRKKEDKRKRVASICILFAGAIAVSALLSGGVAKYVHQESREEKGDSEQFYFTSNYLTEEGTAYTLSADTTDLTIELRNYEDALRWSDSDITYSYTVTKEETNETGSGVISTHNAAGNKEEIHVQNMSAGTYRITATATAPYEKALAGTFTVPEEEGGITYTVNDSAGSPYVLLTVSTDAYAGTVTIKWPQGLIPDSTQTELANVQTLSDGKYGAGNINIAVTGNSSYTYRFFKTDTSKIYSSSEVTAVIVQ